MRSAITPLMTILLPLIGLYIAVRGGGLGDNRRQSYRQKDQRKSAAVALILILIYGILRNIPVFLFTLLAPGGLAQMF